MNGMILFIIYNYFSNYSENINEEETNSHLPSSFFSFLWWKQFIIYLKSWIVYISL